MSQALLNAVNEDHRFQSGDWLVVPSQSSRQVKQPASIDASALRRSPPLESLRETQEPAGVRFGDNLVKIAELYNLSLAELLSFNPGLEAARLMLGTQIRTAQSSPDRSRMILGLNPSASGGLSWTDQAQFSSGDFVTSPQAEAIKICRSGRKRSYDNILVERLWRTLKYQEAYQRL